MYKLYVSIIISYVYIHVSIVSYVSDVCNIVCNVGLKRRLTQAAAVRKPWRGKRQRQRRGRIQPKQRAVKLRKAKAAIGDRRHGCPSQGGGRPTTVKMISGMPLKYLRALRRRGAETGLPATVPQGHIVRARGAAELIWTPNLPFECKHLRFPVFCSLKWSSTLSRRRFESYTLYVHIMMVIHLQVPVKSFNCEDPSCYVAKVFYSSSRK